MKHFLSQLWRGPVLPVLTIALALLPFPGCKKSAEIAASGKQTVETNNTEILPDTPVKAGIAVPLEVRQNLGISFAQVERRQVEDTLRIPGVFELLPGARHEYHAPLEGHVHLAVKQFQNVEAGDLLFSLDSPDWRRMQHEAVEAEGEIIIAEAALRVAMTRLNEARNSAALANERVENLATLKVRKADLEAEAAALNSSLIRLQAEIDAAKAAQDESREHYRSRLNTLSSITSIPVDELLAPDAEGNATWRSIMALPFRAKAPGVVENIAVNEGAWVESNVHTVTLLNPEALRFQGKAPQSLLLSLRDGLSCRIVPPQGSPGEAQGIPGIMQIGLTAHDEDRTIPVFVTPERQEPWTRAGVTAYLEIPRESAASELAIPTASLVQEGLDTLFFRRDPKDPNRVLPVKADLGPSDGRWVVVRSGVKEGDDVVLDGAYALKLAGGANKAPDGYHYHADGQLHKNH